MECKYLLLKGAFEILGFTVVEFHTNWFNSGPHEAILRLGAKEASIFGSHQLNTDRLYNDSVFDTISVKDWSKVKKALLIKMDDNDFLFFYDSKNKL